jgi:hypothetical protein
MKHLPLREFIYAVAFILLLIGPYTVAYFAMARKTSLGGGCTFVEYRYGGEWSVWLFAPVHEADRVMRGDYWFSELDSETSRRAREDLAGER